MSEALKRFKAGLQQAFDQAQGREEGCEFIGPALWTARRCGTRLA